MNGFTDIDGQYRDDVLEYLIEKYGRDQVALVGNILYYAGKSVIRDLSNVYDIPAQEKFEASKEYNNDLDVDTNIRNSEKIASFFKKFPEMKAKVDRMCGTVSGTSVHAGGVVVTDKKYPIMKYCALQRPNDKDNSRVATLWPKDELQQIGLIKYDILGLSTAGQLRSISKLLGTDHYEDCPEEIEVFQDIVLSNKHKNIFQFESVIGKQAFDDLKPMSIMELANASGIIRVLGSEAGRSVYNMYRENVEAFQLGDTTLWEDRLREEIFDDGNYAICKDILKESYGLLIYQEQLSFLVVKLSRGNRDFNDGNQVRKDLNKLSKKYGKLDKIQGNKELLQKWHSDFMSIMDKYLLPWLGQDGYDTEDQTLKDFLNFKLSPYNDLPIPTHGIIAWMISSSGYIFSKLHSIAYSINSYNMMYYKHYYPLEFWCGCLQYSNTSMDKVKNYVMAINGENKKIKVLPPDVNKSDLIFKIETKKSIRFGLASLMNLGKSAEAIIQERLKNGKFVSIEDFCARLKKGAVPKSSIISLLYSGAFLCFGDYQEIYDELIRLKRISDKDELVTSKRGMAAMEAKYLGVNLLNPHPIFEKLDEVLSISELEDGWRDNVAVFIKKVLPKTTKTGKPYVLFQCIDLKSSEQFNIFDWGNNQFNFEENDYQILHVHSNNGFITLRMSNNHVPNKKIKKFGGSKK